MLGVMEVLGCVLIRGRVTTAYVATFQAQTQVYPTAADLQAFLTAIWSLRVDSLDLVQVRTSCVHAFSPFTGLLNNAEQI